MEYLRDSRLDDWTYNKALQKITESFRVDREDQGADPVHEAPKAPGRFQHRNSSRTNTTAQAARDTWNRLFPR